MSRYAVADWDLRDGYWFVAFSFIQPPTMHEEYRYTPNRHDPKIKTFQTKEEAERFAIQMTLQDPQSSYFVVDLDHPQLAVDRG